MPVPRKILVTGGTSYIDSHAGVELIGPGQDVVIIDKLYNSKASVSNWGLNHIKDGD